MKFTYFTALITLIVYFTLASPIAKVEPTELVSGNNTLANQSLSSSESLIADKVTSTVVPTTTSGTAVYTAVASITIIGQEGMVHAQSSDASSSITAYSLALFLITTTATCLLI
ncbi:hypothetical protein G6F46_003082 [Rhizopus delemar]|uniref:Uncharacterized protein n=3 Tax=Rhizopus TaxID=4842 RepID=I1BPT3_RHIO9|nr:hypothetical protein RO3G_02917 [Rhizopus delemar RA 99-880]KAG1054138.1 hypothetical protein G6F43_003824 [Rhizopus delemar]KAG1549357.1 hypothetical protein G6F51_003112 [Rhizopus arrhizus]KAG1467082.1 hypothetical protein G6F55_000055 [Rhizopus delemar]KAG1502298.1 hypothetical protein G6F54_002463 [Rhizopus delemar]|eukprot:EIE78213.1 hypothetical protein RO3G_02917 [Rhizopus delemar RA 99-880]